MCLFLLGPLVALFLAASRLATLAHRPQAPPFTLLLIAVVRSFGLHSESGDLLLPAR